MKAQLCTIVTDIDIDTETEKDNDIEIDIVIDKEKEHLLWGAWRTRNKNNRPCIDKGGKLWYNSFSDRARGTFDQKVQLSEQISAYR